MKKIGLILLLLMVLLSGCSKDNRYEGEINYIEIQSEKADMSNYYYLEDTDHVFEKIEMSEVVRMIEEGGSGIVYFGYDTCPYCNCAVPVIDEAAKEMGFTVYYVDVYSEYDKNDLTTIMNYSDEYMIKEDGKAVFYVPAVYVIRNGEVVDVHISTVSSHDSSSARNLTDNEKEKLKDIYTSMFEMLIKK